MLPIDSLVHLILIAMDLSKLQKFYKYSLSTLFHMAGESYS